MLWNEPNNLSHWDFQQDPAWPRLHFVERMYAHDETNWWIPNRACAEAMLRSAGVAPAAIPGTEVYLCRLAEPDPWGGPVYPAGRGAGEPGGEGSAP